MNMPSREEQDRIIADMLKAQNNLLNKPTKAQRQRQARIEAEQRATEETVTYRPQLHRHRQVSQTTVTPPSKANVPAPATPKTEFMTFHKRVMANFGGKCAVTGHKIDKCLQAAMIRPTGGDGTSNGILFDTTLRILFERGLMSVDPDTMKVHFNCYHPYSALYEGTELKEHRVKLDMEALRVHWNLFKG
jgi:hypothetical protein